VRGVVVLLAATTIFVALTIPPVSAGEVMKDGCSAEVAMVPSFDARPDTPGTIVLKRGSNGSTDWTPPFAVRLGPGGHVRWWCHSTTGNMFDPGTWRIEELTVGTKCEIYADLSPQSCRPDASIKLGSSAWNGWTPERSRCGNRSSSIRARLGPNRLLEIECLGRSPVPPPQPIRQCPVGQRCCETRDNGSCLICRPTRMACP
jgi:hypothetical protein